MITAKEMADEIVQDVTDRLPSQSIERGEHPEHETIILRMSNDSDYDFEVYCYGTGEGSLCAKPREPDKSHMDCTFWYVPFESDHGDEGARSVFNYMKDYMFKVISHSTRITHRKGFVFGSFVLEADIDGRWSRIYRYGYLRWGASAPKTKGREAVYSAKPG